MIPLSYFLLAWFVFLGLYAVMSLLSVMQMTRFGIIGTGTYLSVLLFLALAALVIFLAWSAIAGVDWSQGVNVFGWLAASPAFGQ